MCKHKEVMTTARNAVVSLRASLGNLLVENHTLNEEISRLENFYDSDRLIDEEWRECRFCIHEVFYDDLENALYFDEWKEGLFKESLTWGK